MLDTGCDEKVKSQSHSLKSKKGKDLKFAGF